ncbi:MAG: threonine-phosphate decarboxylase CobD [Deltaproteobacteria bacterium]
MLYGHGGDIYGLARRLGKRPEEVIDFSSNISPLPPPPGLREVLIRHIDEISRLPEVDSLGLREAIGRRYGIGPDRIFVVPGTTDWIHTIPGLLRPERVVIPIPTYADYEDAARKAGCEVVTVPIGPEGFSIRECLDAIFHAARERDLVFLCNPNNPTGRFIPPHDIADAASKRPQTFWVVDESYAPFVAEDALSSLLGCSLENILILRSFSKIYGVPGLRLGYAVCSQAMKETLGQAMKPWAVGRLSQIAGEYLLKETAYEEEVRKYCTQEKRRLLALLEGVSFLKPLPAEAHFILFQVHYPWSAGKVTKFLEAGGILIRDCSNFSGLDGRYIRMALRSRKENDMLAHVLRRMDSDKDF